MSVLICLGLGPASSWWEGKDYLTKAGPGEGKGEDDWTRPGDNSYRYCSGSSVWGGGG